MLKVVVVDDHPMFRQGVVSVLEAAEGIEVVGEAVTGEEAVRLTLELRPNVVLMDINMPGLNGIEATARIKAEQSDIHILVLTMFKDDASVITAMKAGARGYLLKDADSEDIVDAVRSVASGKAIFSGDVASRMIEFATRPASRLGDFPDLTYREKEVLSLMAEGLTNAEIARALEVSAKTVSNYVSYILNKLQVTTREQAISKAKGQS
ncbi:DNA-binding response regulator [Paenibacillus nanensis]|uniref:DNA-binding response regulator n=1 Tax=Paenibacillus nanensis TaxID=393251 RepID=A0A3A1UU95_9BACL|nr:response regulator transcription factor [Paenibacillus nanensis]RIX52108.1 DNA-binding response regulator [Paenibacillus nanensis]